MFDHIGIVVSDFAKSKAFYTKALAPTGHSKVVEITLDGGQPSAGFCHEDGSDLWISQGHPTHPLHLAFRASSRASVDGDVSLLFESFSGSGASCQYRSH